ncbi:MAG: DUF2231 domain-containing protein [Acidimicrobiia bacterium]
MPSVAITDVLPDVVEMLEGEERLDGLAERLYDLGEPLSSGSSGDALRGVWLGHQLHPLLTDVTMGMYVSAMVLDVLGGKKSKAAAQRLVGLGLLSSLGTAVTGLADYSTGGFYGKFHRVGVVHAAANGTATCLFYRSWRARRRGHHVGGMVWALLGAGALAFAGYLGGHMVFGSNRPKDDENDEDTSNSGADASTGSSSETDTSAVPDVDDITGDVADVAEAMDTTPAELAEEVSEAIDDVVSGDQSLENS